MSVSCPQCGSRFLDLVKARTLAERWAGLQGVHKLRCFDCRHQFTASTLILEDFKYARCPKCLRMDLNLWSEKDFEPTRSSSFWIALGARKYRCEYCRLNFTSFRRRKEIFSFRRWAKYDRKTADPKKAA